MKKPIFAAGLCWLLLGQTTFSQEDGIAFTGQVRTKSIALKSTENSIVPVKHELRTRVAIIGKPVRSMAIHVELQDSRDFGSEPELPNAPFHTATISNSHGVDLHQAFYAFKIDMVEVKVGRQKIAMGSQRFVSSLEWHPNARVFDAALAKVTFAPQSMLTGFSALVRDTLPNWENGHLTLSGAQLSHAVSKEVGVELYGYVDQSGKDLADYLIYNIGARMGGETDLLFYDEEFQFQGGEANSANKAAFYNATRVGLKLDGNYRFSLGLDMMSGSDDGTRQNTYEAKYYFAHQFFGWMDYFTVNPDAGVLDLRLDGEIPFNNRLKLHSQNHYFLQASDPAGDPYGVEFDLEFRGKFFAKSTIILGGGVFVAMGGPGISEAEPGMQVYLMPVFNF